MGIGNAFKNVFRGVSSLLETGSWKIEEVANDARTAEALLDRVDEEVELRAQETLDEVNAALTEYGQLKNKHEVLSKQVSCWEQKAKTASEKAKSYPEGSPDREKWTKLTRQALEQKGKFSTQLKVVEEALAGAQDDANKALALVEKIGFTKEQALSQRDALSVSNATANAKLKLANAQKTWSNESGPGALLVEAQKKVNEALAKAAATQQINEAMPTSADDVSAAISREERKGAIDSELAELMK